MSDAWSWGQRTQSNVDYMNDEMEKRRLGCDLPPQDGSGGLEDDWPNCDNIGMGGGYMGNKNLEKFRAHDDDGTSVKPMWDNQATYSGYDEVKHGFERKRTTGA